MKFKNVFKGPFIWILLGLVLLFISLNSFINVKITSLDTSTGIKLIKEGKVEQAKIYDGEKRVQLILKDNYFENGKNKGKNVQFNYINSRDKKIIEYIENNLPNKGFTDQPVQSRWISSLFTLLFPILIIGLIFWFLLARMQGSGSRIMQFGRSRARLIGKNNLKKVTFKDIAGAEEAIEELVEIKDFLKEPNKFKLVGAKIPKGILLYGPPGTGKTLLARAVAGEANVPFYSMSGSDFVEMFVGVGASRVRDLFHQAKKNSPAIIFVDEIDAVGRHRGAGIGGGNDEREQTLNQLLVEMDGFNVNTNIILIAATNRPDVLDPALLRPGRFDRQIFVEIPNMLGRESILKVHARNKPIDKKISLKSIAQRTPGFTGADLENVLNEAALLTARSNAHIIDIRALDEAVDRVIAGPQKRTRIMKDHEKKITAYHEAGHAIVSGAMHNTDPVTKITILPRGKALGYTMSIPQDDKYSITKNELLDQLAYIMGGRVAEEIIFKNPTTGASNDIDKATSIARKMITQYGMSENIGTIKLGNYKEEPFLGRDTKNQICYSEKIAFLIDQEMRNLIDTAYNEAYEILINNRIILDRLVSKLLEFETLNQSIIEKLFLNIKKSSKRVTENK